MFGADENMLTFFYGNAIMWIHSQKEFDLMLLRIFCICTAFNRILAPCFTIESL